MKVEELENRMTYWYAAHRKIVLYSVLGISLLLFSSALYVDHVPNPPRSQKELKTVTKTVSKIHAIPKVEKRTPSQSRVPASASHKHSEGMSTKKEAIIPTPVQNSVVGIEEYKTAEAEESSTVLTHIHHNTVTRAIPKQYVNAVIPGKQVVSAKHPHIRLQLLAPLQLEKITLPKGTYLNGVAHFENDNVRIEVTRVRYNEKNYAVALWVTNGHGQLDLPVKKSKVKFNNATMIVETQ